MMDCKVVKLMCLDTAFARGILVCRNNGQNIYDCSILQLWIYCFWLRPAAHPSHLGVFLQQLRAELVTAR